MRLPIAIGTVVILPILLALIFFASTGQDPTEAAPLAGAIFTTTPDGGIVNENVHYDQKIEVYLDGGPGPNAPQTAAGLPNGDYVFQVSDPSGKVLLSEDPAKCRVFRVADGVIVALRDKINGSFVDHSGDDGCHIIDAPDGAAGASGKHDTNTDTDHGPPAIVVQLMPFFDTPNPGGVYKAWVIPLQRYGDNGGDLEAAPVPACERRGREARNCNGGAIQIGYQRDDGFGPPRDQVKTDNFKVREFFPPEITVRKFHDIDADSVWDADEPEIGVNQCVDDVTGEIITCPGGWPYSFTEPMNAGTLTNGFYTPHTHVAGIPGTYTACEIVLPGWVQSAAYVDGMPVERAGWPCASVPVAGASGETHEIIFGDFRPGAVQGKKVIDLNADGSIVGDTCNLDPDPFGNNAGCQGITIHLFGTENFDIGNDGSTAVDLHDVTDDDGEFSFDDLAPGSYTLCEEVPDTFFQSYPPSGPLCTSHPPIDGGVVRDIGYAVSLVSDQVVVDRDFGNYSLAEIRGIKFFDRNGDGDQDDGEEGIPDVEIHLDGTDGTGAEVHEVTYTCGGVEQPDCMGEPVGSYWFVDLIPGDYTITEVVPDGFTQTFPTPSGVYEVNLISDEVCTDKDFGNFGPCDGLTPGYWSNWRNHYTEAQFLILLEGTVASSITQADFYLNSIGCDNGDALHCMRRFLLADQLTLNLTQHPELPNPDDAGLVGLCSIPGIGTLQQAIDDGLAILADPSGFSRDDILAVKNRLASFAELNG